MKTSNRVWTLAEIVSRLGGELIGSGDVGIGAVAPLASAVSGSISFVVDPKYLGDLRQTQASAVILSPRMVEETDISRIVHANPYAYYARVVSLLYPQRAAIGGVHPSAVVNSSLPASVEVGANAVIGRDVVLGERVLICPGVVIGDGVAIGDDALIYPGVVVYDHCIIGRRAIVHGGTVIGSDGFGFAKDGEAWVKIPQIGRVVIGDDVEIGANTAIDRGTMDDTVIGDGVKLDNQLHIAHNVHIGDYSALAGCVGIAGSTHFGRGCTVGGGALISGHLELGDGVHVSGGTVVTKSLPKSGQYTGIFPIDTHEHWLKNAGQVRRLDVLQKRVSELEKLLAQMGEQRAQAAGSGNEK